MQRQLAVNLFKSLKLRCHARYFQIWPAKGPCCSLSDPGSECWITPPDIAKRAVSDKTSTTFVRYRYSVNADNARYFICKAAMAPSFNTMTDGP